MADVAIQPPITIDAPIPEHTDDASGMLTDLEDAIQAAVDHHVGEQHITPLRCRLLEGRTLAVAHGVTRDDWADFAARTQVACEVIQAKIDAAKATEAEVVV